MQIFADLEGSENEKKRFKAGQVVEVGVWKIGTGHQMVDSGLGFSSSYATIAKIDVFELARGQYWKHSSRVPFFKFVDRK